MSSLLALVLATSGVLRAPELHIRAGEDSDDQALVDLCHLPGAVLELRTRSNMLATGTVDALERCRRPIVQLRAPILPVHRERLAKLPGAEVLFELPQDATLSWAEVSALGPRRVHLRLGGVLTPERAAQLARFRNVEIELDLRGRIADAEELARFRNLDHADRALRLGADAPPESVAGLAAVAPTVVTVETRANGLTPELLGALEQADLPTRIGLAWPLLPRDAERFSGLRRLSLELELGTVDEAPRKLRAALAPLEPDVTPPASGAAPGPSLPR